MRAAPSGARRPYPTPHPRPVAVRAAWAEPRAPPPPSAAVRLERPIAILARASRRVTVQDPGGPAGLDAYMRLPACAYDALDPGLIARRPGGSGAEFTLHIPKASLLGVWVQPSVDVCVASADGGASEVVIASTSCCLRGSPAVERLLEGRFAMAFETVLTWVPAGGESGGTAADGVALLPAPDRAASIQAACSVHVWTEAVGPFVLTPRAVLRGAGDALLRSLTAAMLPFFLTRLTNDYARWATDAGHRAARLDAVAVAQARLADEAAAGRSGAAAAARPAGEAAAAG